MAGHLHGSGEIVRACTVGFLGACTALAVACSKEPAVPANPPPQATAVPAPTESGILTVTGRSPAASSGYPSIVLLEPRAVSELPPQAFVPIMDQVQQTFIPPLLLVRTGQPTEFRNNDDVLHNVRVREDATRSGAFNVAIPTGEKYIFTFQRDGFYDVGCDIHPGMSAQIMAASTPYMTTADNDGAFVIENVPAGSYKATVYAGGQKIEKTVDLAAGKSELDLLR